ncbi:MAG: TOBE domain-containing protein, partial [Cyanobacteria bacterium P01_F01_bin.3]
ALAIADKVAVMQDGQLVQLDAPEDIYQAPASRFIAEFVTQANFVSASQREGYWETEIGSIPTLSAGEADSGELMICQEDVEINPDAAGHLEVQGRQFLGREYQYTLRLPSARVLQVRTGAHQRLAIGDRVSVKVNPERVRLFTADGKVLCPKAVTAAVAKPVA